MYRGSRKHVLDWTDQPDFIVQLLDMILPQRRAVDPCGHRFPDEARMETFDPQFVKWHPALPELRRWWLRHERGVNMPN